MSVDEISGLSLKEGSDYLCAKCQVPSVIYGLCFMLFHAE